MKICVDSRKSKKLKNKLLIVGTWFCLCTCLSAQTSVSVGVNGYAISSDNAPVVNPLDSAAAASAVAATPDTAAQVPVLLKGIWYNSNRYVIFDTGYGSELTAENGEAEQAQIPQLVLRTFYTWYDDRAAEPNEYTKKTGSKTVNVAGADTSPEGSTTSPLFTSTNTATSGSARNYTYATRVNSKNADTGTLGKAQNIPATARDRNNTTDSSKAEELKIRFVPLLPEVFPASYNMTVAQADGSTLTAAGTVSGDKNGVSSAGVSGSEVPSGAWDLQITYSHDRTVYHVPAAVIGNNLYLHFTVKVLQTGSATTDTAATTVASSGASASNGSAVSTIPSQLYGFWQDNGNASGILISPPYTSKELLSYYITNDSVYHIRYWQTDMEYDPTAEAVFSDGNNRYTVKKHLLVGGLVYTCVPGRGTKIRNIEKSNSLPEKYTLNSVIVSQRVTNSDGSTGITSYETATICALGDPYLSLTDGKQTIEQLVLAANSRHIPLPKPLFPPSNLDFHWDIIRDLRKYNKLFN